MLRANKTARATDSKGFRRMFVPGQMTLGVFFPATWEENGALVDYVTADEMIAVFQANWPGGALAAPRDLTIGYHPPNFSETYKARIFTSASPRLMFLASASFSWMLAIASGLAPKVMR